jgi:hemerythrin superfamily protein
MDAIQMLQSQHREAEALLEDLARPGSEDERCERLRAVARALTKHTILEETYFYGSVCQRGLEELTHRARHEHEEIKYQLDALAELPSDPAAFASRVGELRALVKAHIHEEETILFPRALTECDAPTLEKIAFAMEDSSHVWDKNEPAAAVL